MKILQVIHGYPPAYSAGSELYTQTLSHALTKRHEVHVFTRQEHQFQAEYGNSVEQDDADPRVTLHYVNTARGRDRYRHAEVDRVFGRLLDSLGPDIVHVGHLNHLSTSLIFEAREREIPVVFTLHDYWLMCPRGQFIQNNPSNPTEVWAVSERQDDRQCAELCYSRYFSGDPERSENELAYWTEWVRARMDHVREVCEAVDMFIAPSHYLLNRFRDDFGIPGDKLVYLDYGFDLERLAGRHRETGERFTFGYIGTHTAAKGIQLLIEAFGRMKSDEATLRIWGRPRSDETSELMALAQGLPEPGKSGVQWMGEYNNLRIVPDVFESCDAIVVPSIWAENSPLVIHEALQARVPVITADYGGMKEYVNHEVNGLLFAHRDADSLADQMLRLARDPDLARSLGSRGYLQSPDGNVPSISEHVRAVEDLYDQVVAKR